MMKENEMNTNMINSIAELGVFIYIIFLLLCIIIISKVRKQKENIQFYWGNRLHEKVNLKYSVTDSFQYWAISIGIVLLLTVFFLLLCNIGFGNLEIENTILRINKVQEIVVADLAAVSAFSLVMVIKKPFYLGISIQDVLRNTSLLDDLQYMGIDSTIIILGCVLQQIGKTDNDVKKTLYIIVSITYVLWMGILLHFFCKIVKLVIGTTKSELKTFNVLKYRITSCYRIEDRNIIGEVQINSVAQYLLERIQKNYVRLKGKRKDFDKVEIHSIRVDKNKWINISSTICMAVMVALFIGIGWMMQFFGNTGVPILVPVIVSVIAVLILIVGYGMNVWTNIWQNKCYYVFRQGKRNKIVMNGSNVIWKRRYDFIGGIQDLMGLYMVLLDNDVEKENRDIVVQTVGECIESDTLKDVLYILISYLEYQNIYKKNICNRKKKHKDSIKKINNTMKKESAIYSNKTIAQDSLEFTLPNAILNEIYKMAKDEKGIKNYQVLKNDIFESMVEYINKHRANAM